MDGRTGGSKQVTDVLKEHLVQEKKVLEGALEEHRKKASKAHYLLLGMMIVFMTAGVVAVVVSFLMAMGDSGYRESLGWTALLLLGLGLQAAAVWDSVTNQQKQLDALQETVFPGSKGKE